MVDRLRALGKDELALNKAEDIALRVWPHVRLREPDVLTGQTDRSHPAASGW